MKEPIATMTNLAYGAAGLLVITAEAGPTSGFVGAGFLMLMLGSGLFHGLQTKTGQAADEMAMYFAFAALNAHMSTQVVSVMPAQWHIALWFVIAVIGSILYQKTDSFIALPGLVLLLIVGISFLTSLLTALALFGCYLLCIGLRFFGKRWEDESWQGDLIHGLWHLATAYTMYLSWQLI